MRSTAQLKGHPIHPALIPFPFAFLVGALLADVVGWLLNDSTFAATARHLTIAGIGFGLLAAVPGVIDYLYTVPPHSSGQKRARTHGLLNVAAIVLFGVALAFRDAGGDPSFRVIPMELLGAGCLVYSGWLGGTLVNRNLISVDHRYANAGKWKEERLSGSGLVVAGTEDELKPGQMKLLHIDGRRIALGRTERGYVAFDDRCTHRGGSLAGGVLIGHTVQCLWHGSQFNVDSGKVECGPAKQAIGCYRVDVKDGKVRIEI
jgi:nitrite reductase/ring-hydroxylating ferredoxin subunit/uncharacterized membrane protein